MTTQDWQDLEKFIRGGRGIHRKGDRVTISKHKLIIISRDLSSKIKEEYCNLFYSKVRNAIIIVPAAQENENSLKISKRKAIAVFGFVNKYNIECSGKNYPVSKETIPGIGDGYVIYLDQKESK